VRLVAIALLVGMLGCSFVTVRGPRTGVGQNYLDCTRKKAAPFADLIAGGALVATGVTLAYLDRHADNDTGTLTYAATLPLLGAGVAFLWSSTWGRTRVNRGRAAHAAVGRFGDDD